MNFLVKTIFLSHSLTLLFKVNSDQVYVYENLIKHKMNEMKL